MNPSHILILALFPCSLQAEKAPQTQIIVIDPRFENLINPSAQIEKLASGFSWAEGPVWDTTNDQLLFSDVPKNTVHSWSEKEGLQVYLKPSGYTGLPKGNREPGSNGLAFDAKGQLITCEHGDRRLSVLTAHGGKRTLTDNFEGKRLNSPNDLVVHSSGAIFFTDPPYGLPQQGEGPERELAANGVYRLDPDGTTTQIISDLIRPNGVTLSPDEKTLYIAQSHKPAAHIISYPLDETLNVGAAIILFDASTLSPELPGLPDGLKVDQEGNIWSTGPGGVFVLSPEGELLGRILTGRKTANLSWGGEGSSTLYFTAHQDLLRMQTKVKSPLKK